VKALAVGLGLLAWAAGAGAQTVQERLGHPKDARLLVLHADDLGMAHSVNRATLEALEKGWITSSSILVPCPWFPEVAAWARQHPDADLGIHLALTSEWAGFRWAPISPRDGVPSLLDSDGYLPPLETAVAANAKPPEVERELRAQVAKAEAAGIHLTHLDSHMAALFQTEPLFDVYRRLGRERGLPVLMERTGVRGGTASAWATHAEKDALVDAVLSHDEEVPADQWQAAYEKRLAALPPGVYELILHLAYDDDEMRGATFDHPGWGAAWRQRDLDVVKSESFRAFLKAQGFVLVGWKDLARAMR
jgi:predicted glycoside hydrolase/deacetylase ChbG (UPF0249 family)